MMIFSFFKKDKSNDESVASTTKKRLQVIIRDDHSCINSESMIKLRKELIEVVNRYFEGQTKDIQIHTAKEGIYEITVELLDTEKGPVGLSPSVANSLT